MKVMVLHIKRPKVRKFWSRSPISKIKESAKLYDRKKKEQLDEP